LVDEPRQQVQDLGPPERVLTLLTRQDVLDEPGGQLVPILDGRLTEAQDTISGIDHAYANAPRSWAKWTSGSDGDRVNSVGVTPNRQLGFKALSIEYGCRLTRVVVLHPPPRPCAKLAWNPSALLHGECANVCMAVSRQSVKMASRQQHERIPGHKSPRTLAHLA